MGDLLTDFGQWLLDLLLFIPRKIWQLFLEGAAAVLNALPVPEAFARVSSGGSSLAGSVVWFLDIFAAGTCFSIIIGAAVARFLLRRIPGIG